PTVVVSLAVVGTIFAILYAQGDILIPLIAAWSITAVIVLVTVLASLNVIRQVRRAQAEPERGYQHASDAKADFQQGGARPTETPVPSSDVVAAVRARVSGPAVGLQA